MWPPEEPGGAARAGQSSPRASDDSGRRRGAEARRWLLEAHTPGTRGSGGRAAHLPGPSSPEGSSGRRLFLATSASAPKPRPTARPARKRRGAGRGAGSARRPSVCDALSRGAYAHWPQLPRGPRCRSDVLRRERGGTSAVSQAWRLPARASSSPCSQGGEGPKNVHECDRTRSGNGLRPRTR